MHLNNDCVSRLSSRSSVSEKLLMGPPKSISPFRFCSISLDKVHDWGIFLAQWMKRLIPTAEQLLEGGSLLEHIVANR